MNASVLRAVGVAVLWVSSGVVAGCGDDDGAPAGMDAGADAGARDGSGPVGDGSAATDAGHDGAVTPGDGGGDVDARAPSDAGPPYDAGLDDYCMTPSDCVWGEIDHEILRTEDCICLFGCPTLPQSVTTRDRRAAQYADKCNPAVDGMGRPCPIDDCIGPPPLTCEMNRCTPSPDGGAI